ncbi:unnamed protein product [Owenia fusiformis]|uniref:Uncharacterized protein n=1 Tax=Owenia fusiformis TaxID=6347 RepID=A0A8J1TV08_OWEFU|nr:unnamed protein product [Owenia fusiformis]
MNTLLQALILFLVSMLQLCYSKPPNIVFIVADDLGWNDVGWRNEQVLTPNLDKLAREGVILNSSYVQPVCTPSRNAFLTGYFPFHTGLQHFVIFPPQPYGLPLKFTLLPERLRKLGYDTHMVGKWHLGFCKWEYTPTYRGFDTFLGYYNGEEHYFSHDYTYQNKKGFDLRNNTKPLREATGDYSANIYATRAIEILENHNKSKPLFLYLPFQSVHAPLEVPERYKDLYPAVKTQARRTYLAMVSALDEAVGNITDTLKKYGYMDDTLIVFTTDNGGPVNWGANNWPLRGAKVTLWEGGTKASAFVHGPMLKKRGYTNTGL